VSDGASVTRPDLVGEVFGEGADLAERYVELLCTVGVEWGLIGPREPARIWERHVFNSVALRELVPEGSSVIDVGSGAGLPGIPLAISRRDVRVTLLEPLLRRSTFLSKVVDALALGDRVSVVRGRAEDWPRRDGTFDVVASRAVAPLERLVGWTRGLRSPTGEILALKGESAQNEVDEARPTLRTWGLVADVVVVRAYPAGEPTRVARVRPSPRASV
jgi:16S rRNA (guanine527-N7)-methyltransferase